MIVPNCNMIANYNYQLTIQLTSNKGVTKLFQKVLPSCLKNHVTELFCRRVVLIPMSLPLQVKEPSVTVI